MSGKVRQGPARQLAAVQGSLMQCRLPQCLETTPVQARIPIDAGGVGCVQARSGPGLLRYGVFGSA